MNRRGQSALEYFIIMAVILGVILAGDFVGKFRGVCERHFNTAASRLSGG